VAEQIGIKLALDGAGAVQSGLRNVSDALGNLGTRTLSVADAFKSLAPALAASLSVGAITAWARGAVNAIDAMNDLADATGATVEQISALDGFARRTGTTLDSVGGILVKFNAVLNQTAGADNGISQALRAIGLDTAALRRADPVQALQQTAQALANYADDANKARLVQELFGKSIREAAPILKDLAEAGQLNATVTARQAAEAEKFNRTLAQFKANAEDAGRAVINALLPSFNDLLQRLNAAREAFGSLSEFFQSAMTGQGLFNFSDPAAGYQEYTRRIAELDAKLADTRIRRSAYELQGLRKHREELERYQSYYGRLANMQGAFGAGAGRGGDPRAGANRPAPSVPDLARLNDAQRARQTELDIRAAQDLARQRRVDQAEQEADAAARQRMADERKREESYAEWLMQEGDEVARTLIEHEKMVADYARKMEEARMAELRIRADQQLAAIQRTDQAQAEADAAAARAAQERLDADARESLAAAQRYDDAVNAAEEAFRRQSASYAEYLLTLADDTARALIQLNQYEADWLKQDDEQRRQREASYAEYLLDVQDDVTRTHIADAQAVQRYLDDNTEARTRALQTLGERIAQMRAEAQATELAAEQSISLAEAIEMISIARLREQQSMYRQGSEGWREVQAEIDARLELLRLMGEQRVRDANLRAAQEAANAWQRTVDQISQSLADALMNGGMKAGAALKNYFRTLILQPIIRAAVDPIARGITGALGLAGAANPAAASGGGGGLGGIGSIFSGLSSIGSSLGFIGSGASMTMAGQAIPAFQAAGAAMSGGSIGAGLGIGLGAALPFLALGGILAAGFSRKLKDQGLEGTFGARGFEGSQYQFYKGGFLRSDKTVLSAVTPGLQALLNDTFVSARANIGTMARELGLATDALAGFSKDIKLSFMGLTEEQIQQKLAQELGLVADEMARLVAGSDATADSLQQLYQAVMSERSQLEQRLLQLQGDTAEIRRRERESLHETNRALYDRITALEDEQAAVAKLNAEIAQRISTLQGELQQAESERLGIAQRVISERTALEQRLLQAQGNTAALRERELQALDPLNRAFARFVLAAEDAAAAAGTAAQNVAALAGAGQGIAQFVTQLRAGGSTATPSPAAARSAYAATLSLARAGNAEASGRITSEAQTLIAAVTARARSAAEVRAITAQVAAELEALPAVQSWQDQQAALLQQISSNTSDSTTLTRALVDATAAGFARLDLTADGLLTFGELQAGLGNLASAEQIRALIAQVDTNADGQISELELLGALTDDVSRNTFDTAAETEKTVAQMRSLVTETIVNSGKLTTLNTSIGSLTNALTAANEQQRVQRQIELLQTQGTGAASALGRLSSQYETSRAEAMQRYVDIYGAGWTSEVLNNGLEGLTPGTPEYLEGLVKRLNQLNQLTSFAFGTRLELPTSAQVQAGQLGYRASVTPGTAPQSYITTVQNALAGRTPLQTAAQELEALRQQIRNLGGVPAFATGGLHSGGLRLVGERGPELEVTGPARYWSAADTTSMLGNSQRREELLAAEIRALRAEVAGLRAETRATAENTGKTRRLWERVTRDGESMQVTDVTPAP